MWIAHLEYVQNVIMYMELVQCCKKCNTPYINNWPTATGWLMAAAPVIA
jgi:hypothetical protein